MAKYNIIFLDVDGVLNSMAFYENNEDAPEIDMAAVERLSRIYHSCRCKIVLSSTWRELRGSDTKAPNQIYKYLENCLAEYDMNIYDVTPLYLNNRPCEIAEWLKENKKKVKNYISLDDDFDEDDYEKYGLGGHLVKTVFYTHDINEGGIQEKHIEKAKTIFGKEA